MSEGDIEKIRELTQNYSQDLIRFCQELIRTKSVNGVDSEKRIAELTALTAEKLGLTSRLIAHDKKRPNVFVGSDFNKKSGLLLVAHLDTVSAGDESQWRFGPFEAKIEDGKLFGRGAIDCKVGIALSLFALRILKDLGKANLAKFVGVVDEERGADSRLGARFLIDKGLRAKGAIYTYSGVETITIGHRGGVRLWVEAQGEAVHTGSMNWQDRKRGANAVEAIAKLITRLPEIKMEGRHPSFPGYKFVLTPTLLEGGSGESIVPDGARVLIDARLLPNHDNEEYIKKVKRLVNELESRKIRFNIEVKNNIPGVTISSQEPIVKILEKLDKEVMNVVPEIRGCGPWNEGYMFIQARIPMVCGFGAVGDGAHSINEYVEIESLPKVLEMYVRAAIELSSS